MMLFCGDVQARLAALLDDELRGEEAEAVGQHIDGCAACAQIRSDCLALRAAVAAEPPPETADLWDAVSAQIADGDQIRPFLDEIRRLHDDLRLLRGEVADLRRELIHRPPVAGTRSTPLNFPDAPGQSWKQYRLV